MRVDSRFSLLLMICFIHLVANSLLVLSEFVHDSYSI